MTSLPHNILSLLIFSPLAAAAVAAVIKGEKLLRWWTLAATTVLAVSSLALYWNFDPGTHLFQFKEDARWIPALNINYSLGVDGISLLLVLLTTLIMPLCVLASWGYIQARVREFMICLLIMETAMIGVFCALDFVLFFVFWEAMLIPMALLIGIWGGPRKIYAALKFFIYTMAGSLFLLVAIIALYTQRHTFYIPDLMGRPYSPAFQYWVFLAFFIAFAIKVPMFPFHTWLPAAHVEAPTAGSVLLASVLLKMGAYGFLRFSLPITPDATRLFTPFILGLSVVAILYGGLTALAQSDLKKLVAYSSVAHMGFATLGIFALNQVGVEGALMVMINHGVTTGALFISVGIIYERLHTRDLGLGLGPRQSHAPLCRLRRRLRPLLPGLSGHQQLYRRVPGHERRLRRFQTHDGLRRARRGPGCRLHAAHAPEGRLRRHPQPGPFQNQGPLRARGPGAGPAPGLCLLDRPAPGAVHPGHARKRPAPFGTEQCGDRERKDCGTRTERRRPKAEIRNPKSEIRRKSEIRNPKSGFGLEFGGVAA